MFYDIFDFDMTDKETLAVPEGARLVKIDTGNDMDADYCLVPAEDDEMEQKLLLAFRRRHGNGVSYRGYEDVTFLLDED